MKQVKGKSRELSHAPQARSRYASYAAVHKRLLAHPLSTGELTVPASDMGSCVIFCCDPKILK